MSKDAALRLELEATLAKFEGQMRAAVKSGTVTATTLENRFQAMGNKMAGSAKKGAAGLGNVINISKAGRFALQNTAAQFGDIAVQMEMGTNPMRIMGQQLPQILGGFGALSGALGVLAPLLGVVAAVGFPIAGMLMMTGDEAETSGGKVKTFADKLGEASAAVERAEKAMKLASAGGADDLRTIYGDLTREVTELSRELAALDVRDAKVKVGAALDDIFNDDFGSKVSAYIGGTAGAVVESSAADIELLRQQISDVQAEFATLGAAGLQPLQAQEHILSQMQQELALLEGNIPAAGVLAEGLRVDRADLDRLRELPGLIQQAVSEEKFGQAASQISQMRGLMETLGVETREGFGAELTRVEDLLRQTVQSLGLAEGAADDVAGAAAGITPEIAAATDEAANLARNLRLAMSSLAGVARGIQARQREALALTRIKMETVGQPVERASRIARVEANEATGAAAYAAIRTGNMGALASIKETGHRIEQGARDVAEAEASLREAEEAYAESLRTGRSGGSGGGKSGGGSRAAGAAAPDVFATSDREIEMMQRRIEMIGMTDAQVAELTARYQMLDEAKRLGLALDEQMTASGQTLAQVIDEKAAAVGRLKQEFDQATDKQSALQDINEQWEQLVIGSFDNASGAVEQFKNYLKQALLVYAAFGKGPLAGLFGGDFKGLFGGLGALIGIPSYASGTRNHPGGLARINDGGGGEIVSLPSGAQVIPHDLSKRMARGGASGPPVFNIDARGAQRGVGEEIAAAMMALRSQIPGMAVSAVRSYTRENDL